MSPSKIGERSRLNTRSYAKYLVAGFSSLAVDYGTFIILLEVLKAPLQISVFAGMVGGLITSFTLNRVWVFGARENSLATLRQIIQYLSLFLFNTVFTYYLILWTDSIIPRSMGKLVAMGLIMIWNYIIFKRYIFKNNVVPANTT